MLKSKFFFIPALVALFIAACGGGGSSSSVSSNVTGILAIGDSIGNGFGGTTPWPRIVQSKSGVTVFNDSLNGRQARGSVQLVRLGISRFNPSHVIIMLGTNDARNGSVSSALNSMRQIVQEAQAAGVVPIVATLPPIPRSSSENSRARQISSAYRGLGVAIAEVEGAFGSGSGLFLGDNFHPNNAGQELIANAFLNVL